MKIKITHRELMLLADTNIKIHAFFTPDGLFIDSSNTELFNMLNKIRNNSKDVSSS